MIFLAACALALSHCTGKPAVAIWSHLANRRLPQTETAVGFFINSHLLGIDLSENPTGVELLGQVRRVVAGSLLHEQIPLLHLWRVLKCAPRFYDTAVLIDFLSEAMLSGGGDFRVSPGVEISIASLPDSLSPRFSALGLYIVEERARFSMSAQYAASRFQDDGVRELLENLKVLVLKLVTNADALSSQLVQDGNAAKNIGRSSNEMEEFILLDKRLIPSLGASPNAEP